MQKGERRRQTKPGEGERKEKNGGRQSRCGIKKEDIFLMNDSVWDKALESSQ